MEAEILEAEILEWGGMGEKNNRVLFCFNENTER